jgi:D-beta-D-heptose 7-phosphate kinase/D-beta-D-heptose 1-phosphate adenosyltransferase
MTPKSFAKKIEWSPMSADDKPRAGEGRGADEDLDTLLFSSKILSWRKLIATMKELRKIDLQREKIIGMTSGCFDLLHLGHLYALKKAKSLCDVLIVGVNSDHSVRHLKGDCRPIQDERTRSLLIASLACVDYVVLFDEASSEYFVDIVQPNLIIKDKYKIRDWPAAEKISSFGGKIIKLDKIDGHSTSGIIEKIKDCDIQ